jgi:FixJ family two-component response regulator
MTGEAAALALRPTRQSIAARPIVHHMARALPWIAIVDDDPSVLKALGRLLRAHAFETRTFGSAREFLSVLSEGLPECLIVDLQMPEMTGLELQRHLTRSRLRIPTIVITAHNDAGARERCETAGAAAFLSKPLQDTSLLAAIAAARGARICAGKDGAGSANIHD